MVIVIQMQIECSDIMTLFILKNYQHPEPFDCGVAHSPHWKAILQIGDCRHIFLHTDDGNSDCWWCKHWGTVVVLAISSKSCAARIAAVVNHHQHSKSRWVSSLSYQTAFLPSTLYHQFRSTHVLSRSKCFVNWSTKSNTMRVFDPFIHLSEPPLNWLVRCFRRSHFA